MVSRSHHWLHQFQLVTEDSLKGATNYGNRATGVGTKHAVLAIRYRDRDRNLNKMNSSALESRDHGLEITRLVKIQTRDSVVCKSHRGQGTGKRWIKGEPRKQSTFCVAVVMVNQHCASLLASSFITFGETRVGHGLGPSMGWVGWRLDCVIFLTS